MARLEKNKKFQFKELVDGCAPERQTTRSAGFDVFATESVSLSSGECYLMPLGICLVDAPNDFYLELHSRSGFRYKSGCESVGVIDGDYRDEIKMILYPKNDYIINKGDRIGQLIPKAMYNIMDCKTIEIDRNGGFGSTN